MIARTNYFDPISHQVTPSRPHLATNPIEHAAPRGTTASMDGGTATVERIKHRILRTREMVAAVGGGKLDWISTQCRAGKIPGAFRLGENGAWRIHSEDFRKWLVSEGISTKVLDSMLESHP